MSTTIQPQSPKLCIGPGSAGVSVSADEFDRADFEKGWRYELINGVLVVSPATLPQERSPNERLGYWLLLYQASHPEGTNLDDTLPEHDILIGDQRRRADRVIWAGLGRQPSVTEAPSIAIEFVSAGKRNWTRDFAEKRREYAGVKIKEYWVINRFDRSMTVFALGQEEQRFDENAVYQTPLLPGFELPLADILAAADRWDA